MDGVMFDRTLRRRCETLVESLSLPDRIDPRVLSAALGAQRGRPIHLLPTTLPLGGPCGMWVSTGGYDAVFYETNTSPLHQLQIVAHEFGHIIAGHRMAQVLDADASRLLLPDLDPDLVRRFLGRTDYSAAEEREAETIASLLVRRSERHIEPQGLPAGKNDVLRRVAHSLGHSRRGDDG